MEITTNNPVSNQVQGVASPPRTSEVKRESEETAPRISGRDESSPDYRISLSDESRRAVAELSDTPEDAAGNLSDEQAAQLAQQTATQLARTNAPIANQAIAKAVDLFT